MPKKNDQTIDQHVADRISKRRVEIGLTQVEVARAIGISFQQYQKYEHGRNRVTAGRLYALSDVLDANIDYFFKGLELNGIDKTSKVDHTIDTIQSARLVRDFDAIPSPVLKQCILNMLRALEANN